MSRPRRGYGAAVILVRGGHVLAISRGHDLRDWGLPAGKVDPGESFEETALRELREETGVVGTAQGLRPVYERCEPATHAKIFLLTGGVGFPPVLRSVPFEGFVEWKRPPELLYPWCGHAVHNRIAFSRIGLV